MKRLIGYNRVSTEDQQKFGCSLEIQPRIHADWCRSMGFEMVDTITDAGVSAAKVKFENREGGQEIMRRIAAGEADGMLVVRFDRAFRITIDGLLSAKWFLDRQKTVLSIEQPLDISTPFGWKMFVNQCADAEYERALIAQRSRETSDGLRKMARKYGPVPFGCVAIPVCEEDGEYELLYRDPDVWAVREQIMRWSSRGDGVRKIAGALTKAAIAAPRGGDKWEPSTVSRIIKTHHDLEHIPYLPEPHDTPVSGADDSGGDV